MKKTLLAVSALLILSFSCKKEGIAQILPKAPKFPKFQIVDSVPATLSLEEQVRVERLLMKWTSKMDSILKRVGEEARDN